MSPIKRYSSYIDHITAALRKDDYTERSDPAAVRRQQERPGCTVGVVDERSEIGGCYLGIPQNDIGIRTDVLDGCPKAEG